MGPLDILQLPEKGGESFDEQVARLRMLACWDAAALPEDMPSQADLDALAALLAAFDRAKATTSVSSTRSTS